MQRLCDKNTGSNILLNILCYQCTRIQKTSTDNCFPMLSFAQNEQFYQHNTCRHQQYAKSGNSCSEKPVPHHKQAPKENSKKRTQTFYNVTDTIWNSAPLVPQNEKVTPLIQ